MSNDAHVEADEATGGDYLMPFQVYAEAVLALVKVTEASRATALRAHVEGTHFHEVAIRDPFEAERAYLDLAASVFGLIGDRFDFGDTLDFGGDA